MSTDEGLAELVTFACSKEAYVYAPLPPATSYGHRAELWNPDKWLKEVRVKVVTAGDLCYVRMLDKENGELFAECPLPHDGTALTTAVEPVVDSSRYFVTRVADRESRKHAFIGIGFRERNDASDFAAALDDYRQYLRRKQEAEQMREEFSKLEAAGDGSAGDAADSAAAGAAAGGLDLSLKPGQTIRINLSSSLKRQGSGKTSSSPAAASSISISSGGASPSSKLSPPPAAAAGSGSSSTFFKLHPPPPVAAAAAAGGAVHSGSSEQQMGPASNPSSPQAKGAGVKQKVAAAAAAADEEGDDWGDFCDAAGH